jgi:PBSX family phage terminase large subunit
VIFEPHTDKQEQAVFSTKRITLCSTGIQWGKTRAGAVKMKLWIHENPGPNCNYIITAPNFKIMQQATLPAFLDIMKGCGEYKKADAVFEVSSGAKVFCRTATDPDSIVGITNVYGIWGDEAGLYPYYFWVNIQGRSRFKQCPIVLTTSLYSFNWVAKELIRETERGIRDDVHLCQAESRENPYFPEEEYEKAKKTMNPARFAMMYGGRPNKMEGLVYDCFDEDINVIKAYTLPDSNLVFAGIDWGYTQPFACTIIAKLPTGRYIAVSEVVQTRQTISEIVEILKQRQKIWNIQRFYCGPDQPGSIKELNRAGLPASPANNDVKNGVDLVYTLIKDAKFQVFKDSCPNLLDEFENYHWPDEKDLKPDQDDKDPNPVKQDDHSLDSLRYCLVSIAKKRVQKLRPKTPNDTRSKQGESIEQKLKRLKSIRSKRHETW